MQGCSRGVHDGGIYSFGDTVFLWRVWDSGRVPGVILAEYPGCCSRGVFAGVVRVQELGCVAAMPFEQAEDVVDAVWCFLSGRQEINDQVAGVHVYEREDVSVALARDCVDRAAHVAAIGLSCAIGVLYEFVACGL